MTQNFRQRPSAIGGSIPRLLSLEVSHVLSERTKEITDDDDRHSLQDPELIHEETL